MFRELGEIKVSIEGNGEVHTARMRGWPTRENRVEKGGTRCREEGEGAS